MIKNRCSCDMSKKEVDMQIRMRTKACLYKILQHAIFEFSIFYTDIAIVRWSKDYSNIAFDIAVWFFKLAEVKHFYDLFST